MTIAAPTVKQFLVSFPKKEHNIASIHGEPDCKSWQKSTSCAILPSNNPWLVMPIVWSEIWYSTLMTTTARRRLTYFQKTWQECNTNMIAASPLSKNCLSAKTSTRNLQPTRPKRSCQDSGSYTLSILSRNPDCCSREHKNGRPKSSRTKLGYISFGIWLYITNNSARNAIMMKALPIVFIQTLLCGRVSQT